MQTEMKVTHTPGPWTYQEGSDAYTHIVRGPERLFITQLGQDTSGVAEANARLMAAAPEMEEALILGLNVLRCLTAHRPLSLTRTECIAFDQIEAAVQKARGGQ